MYITQEDLASLSQAYDAVIEARTQLMNSDLNKRVQEADMNYRSLLNHLQNLKTLDNETPIQDTQKNS